MSTLLKIVQQDCLEIGELQLFNAVESLAEKKQLIKDTKLDANYSSAELEKSSLWQEFRAVVQQIRYLTMTDEEFKDGPVYSALLTDNEALMISTCITKPNKIESIYPQDFVPKKRLHSFDSVFMDLTVGATFIGRIVIQLRSDIVPIAAKYFRDLCTGVLDCGYKGENFWIQEDCCYAQAIYPCSGRAYAPSKDVIPENFILKHTGAGDVGLYVNGEKSNLNGFYITFKKMDRQNNVNVVIGKVVEGLNVLQKMKSFESHQVYTENCGVLQ